MRLAASISVASLFFVLALLTLSAAAPAAANQNAIRAEVNPSPNTTLATIHCSATAPCPMGIADYGTGSAYTAEGFVSSVNFTSLGIGKATRASGDKQMTVQQNLVDYNVFEKGTSGQYWTQDVAYITQLSKTTFNIEVLDNIWNFSAINPTTRNNNNMSGTVYGNLLGACSLTGGKPEFYYCEGNLNVDVKLPFEIKLEQTTGVLTSGTHSGSTYVEFSITVYHKNALVTTMTYDEVAFSGAAPSAPAYHVGGTNPYGLYNDAETVLCGPGGGASVKITKVAAVFNERYLTTLTSAPVTIPHAWSAGYDTAETVSNVLMSKSTGDTGAASAGPDNYVQLW